MCPGAHVRSNSGLGRKLLASKGVLGASLSTTPSPSRTGTLPLNKYLTLSGWPLKPIPTISKRHAASSRMQKRRSSYGACRVCAQKGPYTIRASMPSRMHIWWTDCNRCPVGDCPSPRRDSLVFDRRSVTRLRGYPASSNSDPRI